MFEHVALQLLGFAVVGIGAFLLGWAMRDAKAHEQRYRDAADTRYRLFTGRPMQ